MYPYTYLSSNNAIILKWQAILGDNRPSCETSYLQVMFYVPKSSFKIWEPISLDPLAKSAHKSIFSEVNMPQLSGGE